jgi:hypothetical protein
MGVRFEEGFRRLTILASIVLFVVGASTYTKQTPLTNLYLTLLDRMGVHPETIGEAPAGSSTWPTCDREPPPPQITSSVIDSPDLPLPERLVSREAR